MTIPLLPAVAKLTRLHACLLISVIWAGVYLPALGSLEIKGEEGRRILPAVAMLDTGRWIVPQVGGVAYLSKPPLINWLVAAAFKVTGTRSEWAARAPSALAVLALALTIVATLSAFLTPTGALLAAVFALTNIGLMEKGRLAEIEALYLSLYGIALCLWLGGWQRNAATGAKPGWRAWTLPWVFLGFGLLAKGPLHLLFFYGVVIAVLVCARRWRELWNPFHFVGVVLMLGIFGAWAVPYLQQTSANGAGSVWLAQFQGRMEVNETFRLRNWLLNIPRGLVNYLPWAVLLPLAWRSASIPAASTATETETSLDLAILRGVRWGVGVCFLAVSLAPGGQPRYTLPLLVPASILLALVLTPVLRDRSRLLPSLPSSLPLVWQRVLIACLVVAMVGAISAVLLGGAASGLHCATAVLVLVAAVFLLRRLNHQPTTGSIPTLALASAVGMVLLTADFAIGAVRHLRQDEAVRPVGHRINHLVGPDDRVAVLHPGFLPFLFYVGRPEYIQTIDQLPASIPYLLVRENEMSAVSDALLRRQINNRIALNVRDKRVKDETANRWLLLRLDPAAEQSL